jgi:hypothetical protein
VLTVELERLEATFALAGAASPDDLDLYQRAAGNLRRILEVVGIERRPRNVTYANGRSNDSGPAQVITDEMSEQEAAAAYAQTLKEY